MKNENKIDQNWGVYHCIGSISSLKQTFEEESRDQACKNHKSKTKIKKTKYQKSKIKDEEWK